MHAVDLDSAGVVDQPADGLEHRALAGTVRSDHRDQFAALHAEGDIEEGPRVAVLHTDAVHFENCRGVVHVQPNPDRSAARSSIITEM